MKKNGTMPEISAAASFRSGAMNINTWILFVQYACCFGVELTMNNAAASYFKETFDLTTESAAAIASRTIFWNVRYASPRASRRPASGVGWHWVMLVMG